MTMLRNRVKEMRMVKAADLVAHEANWRTHPPEHLRALYLLLRESSIAGAISNQSLLGFPQRQIAKFSRASAYGPVAAQAGSAAEND
jgi:hypothetical protein